MAGVSASTLSKALELLASSRWAEAEDIFSKILVEQEAKCGVGHASTIASAIDYARVLQYQHKLSEALTFCKLELSRAEHAIGDESPCLVPLLLEISDLYDQLQDTKNMLGHLERILRIREKENKSPQELVKILYVLGAKQARAGERRVGVARCRVAVDISLKHLGAHNKETISSLYQLAATLLLSGTHGGRSEAYDLLQQAAHLIESGFPQHKHRASVHRLLAKLNVARGSGGKGGHRGREKGESKSVNGAASERGGIECDPSLPLLDYSGDEGEEGFEATTPTSTRRRDEGVGASWGTTAAATATATETVNAASTAAQAPHLIGGVSRAEGGLEERRGQTSSAGVTLPSPGALASPLASPNKSDSNLSGRYALGSGPLPPGWALLHTREGRPYFAHREQRRCTWADPRLADPKDALPAGWEQAVDGNGEPYYIDHVHKRTQRERPVGRPGQGAVGGAVGGGDEEDGGADGERGQQPEHHHHHRSLTQPNPLSSSNPLHHSSSRRPNHAADADESPRPSLAAAASDVAHDDPHQGLRHVESSSSLSSRGSSLSSLAQSMSQTSISSLASALFREDRPSFTVSPTSAAHSVLPRLGEYLVSPLRRVRSHHGGVTQTSDLA
eukprot:m.31910 g.31910  ORF g.31910 m.31910 type:complete len:620 (-) comp9351_c2_seq1:25-1884(-)